MSFHSDSNDVEKTPGHTVAVHNDPLFMSLATTVIDEINFPSGRVIENMLGGSATFSMLAHVHG